MSERIKVAAVQDRAWPIGGGNAAQFEDLSSYLQEADCLAILEFTTSK